MPRLIQKISELLVFLKEKDIDIVCLNEVKSWQNENLTDDYFVVTETRASKSKSSMILAKKGTTIIEIKPEKFDRNKREKVFEITIACFEGPVRGHLWVIALYNSKVAIWTYQKFLKLIWKPFLSLEISMFHVRSWIAHITLRTVIK